MARSIWKGTLGFGLVTIGVELLTAEQSERLDLDLLDERDMGRIGYQKINKSTGEVVEQEHIVRGYEVGKDNYVIISDEDLKSANPKATQTIDVFGFVSYSEVPPVYFAKPYYLNPTKGSEKAYALLRDTLRETEQVALARVVVRTRQYIAAVYPQEYALVVQMLRYHDELRSIEDAGVKSSLEDGPTIRKEERQMATRLIEDMKLKFEPEEWHDEYRDDVMKMIKARAKGAKPAAPVEDDDEPRVLDLMEALRRSVKSGKTSAKKSASRSTSKSAKKSTAKSAKKTRRKSA